MTSNKYGYSKIESNYHYFAISSDNEYYLELTFEELSACQSVGNSYRLCHPILFMYSVRTRPSCNLALHTGNTPMMKQMCARHYIEKTQPINQIQQLGSSNKLLVTATEKQFIKHCSGGSQMISIAACTFCIVDLPCGCIIKSEDGIFPAIRSGCNSDNQTEHKSVIQYPTNLLVLSDFLSDKELQEINGSTVSFHPSPLQLPPFEVRRIQSENIAAIEMNTLDLQKVTQLAIEQKPIYATGEAFIDEPETLLEQILKTPYAGLGQIALLLMNIAAIGVSAIAYLRGKTIPALAYSAVSQGREMQTMAAELPKVMIRTVINGQQHTLMPYLPTELPIEGAPSFKVGQLQMRHQLDTKSFQLHPLGKQLMTHLDHLGHFIKPYLTLIAIIIAFFIVKKILEYLWQTLKKKTFLLPITLPKHQRKTHLYLRVYNTHDCIDIYLRSTNICPAMIEYLQQSGTTLKK